MLITTKQKRNVLKSTNQNLELNIRGNELDIVQKTKYLGVQIDCSLDWKEQIKAVSAKVSRAIGFLKHAKEFLPRATLENLYTGIVEPHFRYCCSIWGCCGSSEINRLQKLQNRAARIVTNSSFDTPSRPLIERLGWRTIEQLISNESKTMVFKSLNELAPQYLGSLFKRNSQCSTRHLRNTETDLRVPKKTSANGQKCFSFRGAKLWNSLSAESKEASSLNIFKKSVWPQYIQKVCLAITAGMGPAVVALVVLGWRTGSGRMAVIVLIAVRSGLSCRLGAAGIGAAGSAPVIDFGFDFLFLLFHFQYVYK